MNIEKIAGKVALERIFTASLTGTHSMNMFAALSDEDKAKVIEKVKEKVKGTPPEETPSETTEETPSETPEETSTETPEETPEKTDSDDAPSDELTSIVDGISQEIEQIKSDGQVTPSEVMGLMDNMITMVNELLGAKAKKPVKTASVNRQIRIALKLGSDLSQRR